MTRPSVVEIMEFAGTFAFAISGIRLASAKRFDWFGAYVVGVVTAIGGGTIRDVLLNVTPFWMTNSMYLICSGLALFCENKRTSKNLRGNACHTNSGCLNGKDFIYTAAMVQTFKLPGQLAEKLNVHLVVKKAVNLENISILYYTVPADPFFQKLHGLFPSTAVDAIILYDFSRFSNS